MPPTAFDFHCTRFWWNLARVPAPFVELQPCDSCAALCIWKRCLIGIRVACVGLLYNSMKCILVFQLKVLLGDFQGTDFQNATQRSNATTGCHLQKQCQHNSLSFQCLLCLHFSNSLDIHADSKTCLLSPQESPMKTHRNYLNWSRASLDTN